MHDKLLLRLNKATRRWHEDADEPWLRLLRPDVGKHDYVAQLVRMYGFEAPLATACAALPQLAKALDVRQLQRAELIAQDLVALAGTSRELVPAVRSFSLPAFAEVADAVGWLYVVERSTLLHDRILRHLAARVPEVTQACAYLGAVGDSIGERWQHFGATIDRLAGRGRRRQRAIDAAHDGFAYMLRWFRATEPAGTAAVTARRAATARQA